MKSTPNVLSMVQVCRQISLEVGSDWLGQVLFNFERVEALLDK